MNKRKLIGPMMIGLATFTLSAQSQAEGRVFGNVGIVDAPWSILIGYNDYGRHYYEPRRVEHHHYYHKRRHYGHKRHHYKHRHGHRHQRRHHYRHDNYCHYRRRH